MSFLKPVTPRAILPPNKVEIPKNKYKRKKEKEVKEEI
jgi:hypothetical protein